MASFRANGLGAVIPCSPKVIDNPSSGFGFDAQAGGCVDMLKAGVIDPTRVGRVPVEATASVAGL